MNSLLDLLQCAFESGKQNAFESFTDGEKFHPDFSDWVKNNMKDIEETYHFIKILDNHKH